MSGAKDGVVLINKVTGERRMFSRQEAKTIDLFDFGDNIEWIEEEEYKLFLIEVRLRGRNAVRKLLEI